MMKKCLIGVSVIVLVFLIGACKKEETKEVVSLRIWSSGNDQEVMQEMAEEFITYYKDEANISVVIGDNDEDGVIDHVKKNKEGMPDVYSTPNDRLQDLVEMKAIMPVTFEVDEVIEECGGEEAFPITCASLNNTLYAYPYTASNGYFMYYNSDYFTEEQVTSLDGMLDIAKENGKYIAMDFSSGWYISAFFKGAGLEITADTDGTGNICNWNAKDTAITGVDVVNAMERIARHKGFMNAEDKQFVEEVKKGNVIAGINGTWNAKVVEEYFKDGYAAAKLPTYTVKDQQVQMGSYGGCKLYCVNRYSEHPEWAMRLARWMSNYENELRRFAATGESPAIKAAAQTSQVQQAPAIKALLEQMEYATVQNIAGDKFWEQAKMLGTVAAAGNTDKMDYQQLLDQLVEQVKEQENSE